MKSTLLLLISVTLLTGCVASLAEIRQHPAVKVSEFPVSATALSYCVHRAMEGLDSPYDSTLSGSPNQSEWYVTVTRQSGIISNRRMVGFELYFVTHDALTTIVELREDWHIEGRWLAEKAWPLIEQCSQRLQQPVLGADRSR